MPALQLEPARQLRRAHFPGPRQARPTPQRAPMPRRDATHDFLVPNPRPDLTTDPATLRMLARD
jgi:hypothetical protein